MLSTAYSNTLISAVSDVFSNVIEDAVPIPLFTILILFVLSTVELKVPKEELFNVGILPVVNDTFVSVTSYWLLLILTEPATG